MGEHYQNQSLWEVEFSMTTKLISWEEMEEAELRGETIPDEYDEWVLDNDEPSSRWNEMSWYRKLDSWAIEKEYADENDEE